MEARLYFMLVGLAIGLATFAFLTWLAGKIERDNPSKESEHTAHQLKIMAYANLVFTPILMMILTSGSQE